MSSASPLHPSITYRYVTKVKEELTFHPDYPFTWRNVGHVVLETSGGIGFLVPLAFLRRWKFTPIRIGVLGGAGIAVIDCTTCTAQGIWIVLQLLGHPAPADRAISMADNFPPAKLEALKALHRLHHCLGIRKSPIIVSRLFPSPEIPTRYAIACYTYDHAARHEFEREIVCHDLDPHEFDPISLEILSCNAAPLAELLELRAHRETRWAGLENALKAQPSGVAVLPAPRWMRGQTEQDLRDFGKRCKQSKCACYVRFGGQRYEAQRATADEVLQALRHIRLGENLHEVLWTACTRVLPCSRCVMRTKDFFQHIVNHHNFMSWPIDTAQGSDQLD